MAWLINIEISNQNMVCLTKHICSCWLYNYVRLTYNVGNPTIHLPLLVEMATYRRSAQVQDRVQACVAGHAVL